MKISPFKNIIQIWIKLTNGSVNRKIFGAAVTVGVGTALVKVVAVIKELVVAWKFGTQDTLDAFLIALLVPSFIITVIAGALNAALIPTYIQVREQEGLKAAQRLFSGATFWSLVLLLITTTLTLITAPLYLPLIAGGFSSEKLDLTFKLMCVLSPYVILSAIIIMLSAVLNAGERFIIAALSPILTSSITILLLLKFESWGVFALAAGLVLGAVLESVFLGVALHRQGISLLPKLYQIDANMRQTFSQYLPTVVGLFLMSSSTVIDQSMAAMLSPGSVAALSYGNRVVALPITLATTALSTAVIPYFSKMIALQDWTGVLHTFKYYLRLSFVVTVPLAVVLIVFSEMIVQIFFQRGSFTAYDTHLVAQIQACFALQIPFYIASILVVHLILSMRLNHILMWGSAWNASINITLNYLFSHFMGISGIALSTSCVYIFSFLFLFSYVIKRIPKNA